MSLQSDGEKVPHTCLKGKNRAKAEGVNMASQAE